MNILALIFGDRFAQKVGKTLLKHFESGEFPPELLQYPDLNLLYREFMYDKACRAGSSEGQERIDYLDAMIALRRQELEERSKKSDQ